MTESKPVERETDLVLVKLKNGREKHITRGLAELADLKPKKSAAGEKSATPLAINEEGSK